MDLWDWLTQTSPAQVFTSLGAGTIVVLFVTDRLLTKGQHERRIKDLNTQHDNEIKNLNHFHELELAEKDHRTQDFKESRDYYREAMETERARADSSTDQLQDISGELTRLSNHLVSTFKEVGEVTDGSSST